MDITFYDASGSAIAYTGDNEHIYLYSGEPVACLSDGSVYAYSGKHLGRFANGWIRDHEGLLCIFHGGCTRRSHEAYEANEAHEGHETYEGHEADEANDAHGPIVLVTPLWQTFFLSRLTMPNNSLERARPQRDLTPHADCPGRSARSR